MFYSLKFILASHLFSINHYIADFYLAHYDSQIFLSYFILWNYNVFITSKLFSNSGPEFQDEDSNDFLKKLVHIGNIVLVYTPLPLGETDILPRIMALLY